MIYATLDADGVPTRFYDAELWAGRLPEGVHLVSEEMHNLALSRPGHCWWNGEEFVQREPAAPVPAEDDVRETRNRVLAKSDWTQLADVKFSEETKRGWLVYRQALRDLTRDPGWPQVEWPTPPAPETIQK